MQRLKIDDCCVAIVCISNEVKQLKKPARSPCLITTTSFKSTAADFLYPERTEWSRAQSFPYLATSSEYLVITIEFMARDGLNNVVSTVFVILFILTVFIFFGKPGPAWGPQTTPAPLPLGQ